MGGLCSIATATTQPCGPAWGIRVSDCGDRTPLNKHNAPYSLQAAPPTTPQELSLIAWNLIKNRAKKDSTRTAAKGKFRLALQISGVGRLQPLFDNWGKTLDTATLHEFALEVQFAPTQAPASHVGTYTFEVLKAPEIKRLNGVHQHHASCAACLRTCSAGCLTGLQRCADLLIAARLKKSRRRAARITASLSSSCGSSTSLPAQTLPGRTPPTEGGGAKAPRQQTFEAGSW